MLPPPFGPIGKGAAPAHNWLERAWPPAKKAGNDFVVVLGAPAYYRRFGFSQASLSGIESEYGVDDSFMVTGLAGHSLTSALVRYAPEFAALSE